jgi:cell shape-determining protein MreC
LFGATLVLLAVVSMGMSVIWAASLAERETRREAWETAAKAEQRLESLQTENERLRRELAGYQTNTAERPNGRSAVLESVLAQH